MHSLLALNNNCRTIQFEPVTKDKILKNHVIRNISVQSQSQCQSNCFQEPNCVSYNYGPLHSDSPTCELSNRTHLQVSSSDFLQKREYIHQHIKVRKTMPFLYFCLGNSMYVLFHGIYTGLLKFISIFTWKI